MDIIWDQGDRTRHDVIYAKQQHWRTCLGCTTRECTGPALTMPLRSMYCTRCSSSRKGSTAHCSVCVIHGSDCLQDARHPATSPGNTSCNYPLNFQRRRRKGWSCRCFKTWAWSKEGTIKSSHLICHCDNDVALGLL